MNEFGRYLAILTLIVLSVPTATVWAIGIVTLVK